MAIDVIKAVLDPLLDLVGLDSIFDESSGKKITEDAHKGTPAVKPMEIMQPKPHELPTPDMLNDETFDNEIQKIAQNYSAGVEGTPEVSGGVASGDSTGIGDVYRGLVDSTKGLMETYGLDSSQLDSLGDMGVEDLLSSIDRSTKASEEYAQKMSESIDKRRDILEKNPEANWLVLVAAALLPKRKAAGLVSGYYKGIMERYNRETDRQLAILDDEMKKTKFELDLEQSKTGAAESKFKLKQSMLTTIGQNIEITKKIHEVTNSGAVTTVASDALFKTMRSGVIPDLSYFKEQLRDKGVEERFLNIAASEAMSKTSADWADYQVQASLRSMGGSGKEKDPPPPNVFLTANVEAINNKFNAFYSQLGGAVTSTVNRGLALSAKDIDDKLKATLESVFNGYNKDKTAQNIAVNTDTMVQVVADYQLGINNIPGEFKRMMEEFKTIASLLRPVLSESNSNLSEALKYTGEAYESLNQFEQQASSIIDATASYIYSDDHSRQILTDEQKKKVFSTLRGFLINTIKAPPGLTEEQKMQASVVINNNRNLWYNPRFLLEYMFNSVVTVQGTPGKAGKTAEAFADSILPEIYNDKATPFNNFIKQSGEVQAYVANLHTMLSSGALTSNLPVGLGEFLETQYNTGNKQFVQFASEAITHYLFQGDKSEAGSLYWALNSKNGLNMAGQFTDGIGTKPSSTKTTTSSPASSGVRVDTFGQPMPTGQTTLTKEQIIENVKSDIDKNTNLISDIFHLRNADKTDVDKFSNEKNKEIWNRLINVVYKYTNNKDEADNILNIILKQGKFELPEVL